MRCPNCGNDSPQNEVNCPVCQTPLNAVQVLTPEERENFDGATINSGTPDQTYYDSDQTADPGRRVYVRQINLGDGKLGILPRLIIAALILILIFLFLPLAILIVVVIGLNALLAPRRR